LEKKESEKVAHEAEMKKMMDQLENQKKEKETKDEEIKKPAPISDESDIESRISSLEVELSITCPLCNIGKVVQETTDQNKEYYECNNDSCNFISWSKPYHFECPQCKNNYLVENLEMISGTPVVGLKCPRAGCTFLQHHLNNPAQNINKQNQNDSAKPKKKRRVIKRIKRKR